MSRIASLWLIKVIFGLVGAGAGAGVTMLARAALGLPAWGPGPVLVVGIFMGLFVYLATVSRGEYSRSTLPEELYSA